MATGQVVDEIAAEYAGKPVVLLEYPVQSPPGSRLDRWYAAWTGSTPYLPFDMVDSGQRITSGFSSMTQFKTATKAMLDVELPRPPQAVVKATWQRFDSNARVWVTITNLLPTALSYDGNAAEVHAVVWEDVTPRSGYYVTSRYVRAATSTRITAPLGAGATTSFTLETSLPSTVNWSKLHCLAMVDYRPGGASGVYDMLQAAIATAPAFAVSPDHLELAIGEGDEEVRETPVTFTGPHVLQWTAEADAAWLGVSPTGGALAGGATITVDPTGLEAGLYFGTVTFTATATGLETFTATVPVALTRGSVPQLDFAGVASAPGQNNTTWRSEVVLHNPTSSPTSVQAEVIPRGGVSPSVSGTLTLGPGETRLLDDLYAVLGAPEGAGTRRLRGQTLSWVRTYNQSATGTFGQDAVNVVAEGFVAGERAFFPIHAGADIQHEARSNLLLTNLESTPLDLTLRCNGVTKTTRVPGSTYVQLDKIGQTMGLASGVAALEVVGPGRWSGSVSTVDPGSGDPTTVRGLSLAAAVNRSFPGVARVNGLNKTVWRSELELHNPATEPVEVRLDLVPRGSSFVSASRTLELAAGELRHIADVYAELGATDGAGVLRVSGGVLAWVRTYNQGAAATYGQDVPGWGEAAFAPAGVVRFPVRTPVTLATGFRSNLLLLNLEPTPVVATVRSGNASFTLSLPAAGYAQADNVGARLGLAPGAGVISVTSPGRWAGYISTVDPVTGDPTTARGQ